MRNKKCVLLGGIMAALIFTLAGCKNPFLAELKKNEKEAGPKTEITYIGRALWGAVGTRVNGTQMEIGTGEANTQNIVRVLETVGNDCAAQKCDSLELNGFTDWFLPSRDELNLMYVNLKQNELGGFGSEFYWSSSEYEYDSNIVRSQNFSDGVQNYYHKNLSLYVRAIRAF